MALKYHPNITVQVKTKFIWVKRSDLRCMAIHIALKAKNSQMWYLDSGCSRHMTSDKSMFVSLEKYNGGVVTFSDGNTSKVLYVDGLKANLVLAKCVTLIKKFVSPKRIAIF